MQNLDRSVTTDTTKTDYSSGTDFSNEKGYAQQREFAPQLEGLAEGDEEESGNVGQAEFVKSQQQAEITPEQNKAILRRIDCLLLPL